ncbi:MAG: DUF4236 domain-containing protein [Actinomycetota bacterium]
MGFRYRKSIKLMPGVRMNISKKGIGYSAGVKGARVTRTASGHTYRTFSVPGTGLSQRTAIGGRGGSRTSSDRAVGNRDAGTPAPADRPPRPKPGLFAPAGEKELYRAVMTGRPDPADLQRVGHSHPDYRVLVAALEGFLQFQGGAHDRARELLAWVFAQGQDIAVHPFAQKYLAGATVTVEISPGVSAALPMSTSTVGLAVAELHQEAGDLDAAIATVERVDPPTTMAALSLAELYAQAGRHSDVVDLTDGIANTDDATALMCVFRGIALREQGYYDASRLAFKEALRSRSRSTEVKHRAYLERALSYLAQNRNSMARKDLERVMAEDSEAPGLAQALARLPA